jgi:ElaB/YqjD/DUF883 family membrane-anchored ribosome-binding protein
MEAGLGDAIGDPALQAGGVARQVRAKAGKVLDKAEGLARSTLGEGAARQVREKGEAAADTMQGAIDRAASGVEDAVIRDPYKALAIALGIGLGLGLMMGRRSHTFIYRPIRD